MYQNFDRTNDSTDTAARLAEVRRHMAEAGVTGFLVPRADAHQGETVAPRDERLAWLTGFTGSAGLAVVLDQSAALFVDGRYTLQAARQIDIDAFTVVPSHETPASKWLVSHTPNGARIGYDPWLHGKAEIDRLTRGVVGVGGSLVPLKNNPIDAAWLDQPPAPSGSVRAHAEDLAGESAAEKRRRVAEKLNELNADALVLTLPDNIAWLLNIRGGDLARSPVALAFAILSADASIQLFIDPDKLDGEVREHMGSAVTTAPVEAFGAALDELHGKTVQLDEASAPLWVAQRLEDTDAIPSWGQDPVTALKATKNPVELAGSRAAHLRDGAAVVRFLCWLENSIVAVADLTEIDTVKALEGFRRDTGLLEDIAFDTICGSGPNGAIVHYRVDRESNRTMRPGELLLVDSGGQYRDGTTDITRTVALGSVPAEARRPFTLVLKGMIALSVARWPQGLAGRDLDPLARQHLWRAGMDYDHGTGHGVGVYLNVHEGPAGISRRSGKVAIEPGMILSNEPGYYREGAFGIRIENLVTVLPPAIPEGGDREMLAFETLTLCPIDSRLIDPALLDPPELAWLDAYHSRVAEALTPLLDEDTAAWLARATHPLAVAADTL